MFYGQTGSGKSYYLMGENNFDLEKSISTSDRMDNPNDTRGCIVRMVKNIFNKIAKISAGDHDKEENFRLSMTYYDLYLDKIRDIGKYANEHLREDIKNDLNSITQDQLERQFIKTEEKPDGSVLLKNLTNIDIHDTKEIAFIIDKGAEAQEIINKRLNISESAVHTIITLTFRNDEKKRIGKVCFIDWAGSEWNSKNVTESEGIQESIIINNSFNTLSKIANIIRAKSKNEIIKGSKELSYNDSKLTKILQSVLVPEFKLSVFGTLNPTEENFNEAVSTLRFMDKIRGIHTPASNKVLFSPSLAEDDEPSKTEVMLNRLTMENLELKGFIENQKVRISVFIII